MVWGLIIIGIAAVAVAAGLLYLALKDSKKDADENFSKKDKVGDTKKDCPAKEQACSVKIEKDCVVIHKGKTRKFKAVGAPSGGTYKWTVTGGHASIKGSSGKNTVEVEGDSASGAKEDCELKVEYTKGKTCSDSIKLTVFEVTKIKAKIKSTPRLTNRAGHAAPADFDFESTEKAETMAVAKTLVLMRGDLQEIELAAEASPADAPLGWDVKRASDDAAGLGAGVPTITKDGADAKKAKLKTNEKGSFYVRVFGDCKGSNTYTAGDPLVLLPVVLVEAKLVADNSATHTGQINVAIGGGSIGVRTGSFNINAPNTEAIHMNAQVDVVSGGADGRRHLDRVFAGWVNNERANENIRADYTGAHARFSIFASNRGSATGAGSTFLAADPAPVLVAPPLLDSGRGGAGTGGDTATLTRSRIKSKTDQALGSRWVVESVDSPGDSAPLVHPGFAGTRLSKYHFELKFSAFLAFWTNKTAASGATGDPADRVYAVVRHYNWDMRGEWNVDAANAITVATAMTVAISGASTSSPPKEADDVNCEVRPPTGLSLLANDGRT